MNCTSNILSDCYYNISSLITDDIINDPANWLGLLNSELNGYFILTILLLVGAVIFLAIKRNENTTDVESFAYAGVIISIAGVLLFAIDITAGSVKLISWGQLLPILLVTAIAIGIHKSTQRY